MKASTTTQRLRVLTYPGVTPRIVRPNGREDLIEYTADGGYHTALDAGPLLAEVESSGLRGRGGAGYPLGAKLRSVRRNLRHGDAVVVANGEEGEPMSIKDRWLLRTRPHLVIDGLRLAARAVSATRGMVYLSDEEAARSIEDALNELDGRHLDGLETFIVRVEPGYVAGEETAAVRAINGGPAKPMDKPPRPFERGVDSLPTLVSNVETLANLPFINRHGAAAYRSVGTAASAGTFLATISGSALPPALYEVAHGVRLSELLAFHGADISKTRGVLMGGYSAGFLGEAALRTPLDHESMSRRKSGLGCGAIGVITEECPLAVAASVLDYFDHQNAGQCGSCFNGTAAMAAASIALRVGCATAEDVGRLRRWSTVLRGRGACGTLNAACNIAATVLDVFPTVIDTHLMNECRTCRRMVYSSQRPFEVEPAVTR